MFVLFPWNLPTDPLVELEYLGEERTINLHGLFCPLEDRGRFCTTAALKMQDCWRAASHLITIRTRATPDYLVVYLQHIKHSGKSRVKKKNEVFMHSSGTEDLSPNS